MIGVAALAATLSLAGCADQSGMEQLNKNEFTLRGMIASDHQQIDALKAQVARQNDQIEELQHGAGTAGGTASGVNDRVASLEAEVRALQAGMAATPGAMPPPGAPSDSVGPGPGLAAGPPPTGVTAQPATPAEIAPTLPAELHQELPDAPTSNEPRIKIYRE